MNSLVETPPTNPRKREKRFNVYEAANLRTKHNLSYRKIAKYFGLKDHTYVEDQLKAYFQFDGQDYADNRVKIVRKLQSDLLNSITPQDIEKTPVPGRIVSFGILYDKERLELGKASQIIDYKAAEGDLKADMKRIEDLEKELDLIQKADGTYGIPQPVVKDNLP